MHLTVESFALNITFGSLYVRLWGREAYLSHQSGQPLRFFSGRREGGAMEVWGLGLYGVTNRV